MIELHAYRDRYGCPVVELDDRRINVDGRTIVASVVYWDDEYAAFFIRGHYARLDGTVGGRRANRLVSAGQLPADIVAALRAV